MNSIQKKLALLGMACILAQLAPPATGNAAYAQTRRVYGNVSAQKRYNPSKAEPGREVALMPVRAVAGVLYAPVGAIGGMAKRTSQAVDYVNKRTLRSVVARDERMTEKPGKILGRGLVMVPVGIVGTAAAVPLGAAAGAVEGTFNGFVKGFNWPDKHL